MLGLGLSVWGRRAASADVAVTGMLLGGNLGANHTGSGANPVVNLAKMMRPWSQVVGSGSFTQHCGELTASVSTDEFQSYLSDSGEGIPSGTYTIYNPTGAQIRVTDGVNAGNGGVAPAYSTATSFTFQYTTGNPFYILVKGSLLRHVSDEFGVLLPGYTLPRSHSWHPDFLAFLNGLDLQDIRFMDWQSTNRNLEEDYADRTPPDAISWYNVYSGVVPSYEDLCGLVLLLDSDPTPWFNIPTRATTAYAAAMHTTIIANLDGRLPKYEYSNEIWNMQHPFADNTRWVEFKDHTRRKPTCVGGGATTYTLTGHGIANASSARCFRTKENAAKQITVADELQNGAEVFIEAVDANTIRFYREVGLTNVVSVASGQVNTCFILTAEGGKTADMDAHYGENIVAHFTAMDAVDTDYIGICGSQAANTGVTTARMAVTGMSAYIDKVCIAPYTYGWWFHGAVDRSSGALQLKFWTDASITVYGSQYTAGNGAARTNAEVMAGSGTGFVATKSGVVPVGGDEGDYLNVGTAFAGTNGTDYDIEVVVDDGTYQWRMSVTTSPNASPSTVNVPDSYANQSIRDRLGIASSQATVAAHIAAAGGKGVVAYEAGIHTFDEGGPAAALSWAASYFLSSEFADAISGYLRGMASTELEGLDYFVTDAAANLVSGWLIGEDYPSALTDLRWLALAAFNGGVPRVTQLSVADDGADRIAADPGSFPQTAYTFADPGLTYTLLDNASTAAGNFDISGDDIRLIGDAGINWAANADYAFKVLASDGDTEDLCTISLSTGPTTYYGTNDRWAHNTVTDTDTTDMDPDRGSAVSLAAGSEATASGGLWTFSSGTHYEGSNKMTGSVSVASNEFMMAVTLKKGSASTNGQQGFRVGVFPMVYLMLDAASSECFWYIHNGSAEVYCTHMPLDSTARVYWYHYSPSTGKHKFGYNTTYVNASGTAGDTPSETFPSTLSNYISSGSQAIVLGSSRVLNESGIVIADVVSSLMNVHGL